MKELRDVNLNVEIAFAYGILHSAAAFTGLLGAAKTCLGNKLESKAAFGSHFRME